MVLHCIALYSISLQGIEYHFIILYGIACHCIVFDFIAFKNKNLILVRESLEAEDIIPQKKVCL